MKDTIIITICLIIACFVLFTQAGFELALNATTALLEAVFRCL